MLAYWQWLQAEKEDDDWGDDVSKEAVEERMKELSAAAKGLALNEDLEKTQQERMNLLYEFIKVGSQRSARLLRGSYGTGGGVFI